ncbi:MAG: hypothetical protein V8S31_11700 [Lachnospiraceae bacterium]
MLAYQNLKTTGFAEAEHLPERVCASFLPEWMKKKREGKLTLFPGNYPEKLPLHKSGKKIGSLAFYNCGNLKELTVEKNLCGIGSGRVVAVAGSPRLLL